MQDHLYATRVKGTGKRKKGSKESSIRAKHSGTVQTGEEEEKKKKKEALHMLPRSFFNHAKSNNTQQPHFMSGSAMLCQPHMRHGSLVFALDFPVMLQVPESPSKTSPLDSAPMRQFTSMLHTVLPPLNLRILHVSCSSSRIV